jgi:hypothetical protein
MKSETFIYLAGAVELEDTWRDRATVELLAMGFTALNPLRGENNKVVGRHLEANVTPEMIVARDLNDLWRVHQSAGVCLMHLKNTVDGRRPTATLCELMWCYLHRVPVIAVIGPKCCAYYREHPWVKVLVTHRDTSLTAALDTIEKHFV